MPRAASPQIAVVGGGPFGVVDHPEIEFAVAIVIEPAGGDGPLAAGDAGFGGDVLEVAVSEVAIEGVAIDAGDEEVGVTVVIVVADGGAHGVAGAGDARLFGDVGELPIAFVAIEAVPIFGGGLLKGRDVGAVGEVDVGAAVAIVIEDGDAAGHGLDHVLVVGGMVLEHEGESGRGGDFAKADGGHGRGGGRGENARARQRGGDRK